MKQLKKIILSVSLFLLGVSVLGQRSITLNSLTPNTLCQGSSTIVNFTVTGNGGYGGGNDFNVELSDQFDWRGNFISPTIIGSLPESNAGTYNITTDPITVTGIGYKIQIVSTNKGTTSGSRSIKIYPYPIPNPIIKLY